MRNKTLAFLLPLLSLLLCSAAQAAETRYRIVEGNLVVQPGFCLPDECRTRDASLYGSLTAVVESGSISFQDIHLKSEYSGFKLPADPYDLSNGSVADVKFVVDGKTLTVSGYVDSRAFDGPLIEYSFVADAVEEVEGPFDANDYFLARLDYRRCAAPACGGVFVRRVNNLRMDCPDGSFSRECYVGTLDLGEVDVEPFAEGAKPGFNTEVILKGDLKDDPQYSDIYGTFVVEEVWRSVTGRRAVGRYYGILNNEIVCITEPCYGYDQYALNLQELREISDVDLSEVGASDQDLTEAYRRLAEGEPLLASGLNRRERGGSDEGVRFLATQFYLPLTAKTVDCEAGYVPSDDGECLTRNGCAYPQVELETVGTATADSQQQATYTYSCESSCPESAVSTDSGHCRLTLR